MNVTVGVIILNWNSFDDSKKCLESVLSCKMSSHIEMTVFLIDNGSDDKSGERLADEFTGRVSYYNTGCNGGYTAGNNFGITKALEKKCDYIVILNNDLVIRNFSFIVDDMTKFFIKDSRIGILGFEIYDLLKNELLRPGFTDRVFNKLLGINNEKVLIDDCTTASLQRGVPGCAICFKAACIEEIGMFDESFFMYAEEQDICLRAIKLKWSVAKIESTRSRIFRKIDPISEDQLIWYYGTRNIFYAYINNLNSFNMCVFSLIQLMVYIRKIVRFAVMNKVGVSKKIIKGLLDAISGVRYKV